MDIQKQEMREAVELPLTQFELYKQIGIDPPRGVLMFGPPGCGKTMLAKAVAHHTTASFIRVVGSEFVQKYLGEGPRMVRDVFRLARENSPAIIFIDEIDAIATKRFDAQTGADREVQRILLELLNQMDGFDQSVNVKVLFNNLYRTEGVMSAVTIIHTAYHNKYKSTNTMQTCYSLFCLLYSLLTCISGDNGHKPC
jgi:26S proteasome regulatory subunit T3